MDEDLLASGNKLSCPLCDFVGKNQQSIYRHYGGKHSMVEKYLAQDIAEGKIEKLLEKPLKKLNFMPKIADF